MVKESDSAARFIQLSNFVPTLSRAISVLWSTAKCLQLVLATQIKGLLRLELTATHRAKFRQGTRLDRLRRMKGSVQRALTAW